MPVGGRVCSFYRQLSCIHTFRIAALIAASGIAALLLRQPRMAAGQGPELQAAGCPVHKGRPRTDTCPEHAQQPAAADANGSGGVAQAASSEQLSQPQEPQPDAEAKPMTCPLGFGSDNTAKLDPLNCVLCRSLYHEAVATVCGHRFCRHCITPFRDCPICGADCQPLSDDADMQETVDKYIAVHSRDHKLTSGGKAAPQAEEKAAQHPAAARASFFLQIGLRSFAGGNPAAALTRLQACEAALVEQQHEDVGSAALGTQLGAVCGSQGDALQQLKEPGAAAERYQQAIQHLQSNTKPSAEAQHALSVCHNKLGDLQYTRGNLPAAREQYDAALAVRRALCEASDSSTAQPTQQVDLAASLVKVADINSALGDAAVAKELIAEASDIAASLEAADLDCTVQRKLAGIKAYLESTAQA